MHSLLAFLPQGGEWIYILIIILLLFGAKKLPELARSLGLGVKEFKKATKEVSEEIQRPADSTTAEDQKKQSNSLPQDPKGS